MNDENGQKKRFSANLWDACWKGDDETKPLIEGLIGHSSVHLIS
jgi:hypothetical protein